MASRRTAQAPAPQAPAGDNGTTMMDVLVAREYVVNDEARTEWISVGRAFPLRSGEPGYTAHLNVIPIPVAGKITLIIKPRKPKDTAED